MKNCHISQKSEQEDLFQVNKHLSIKWCKSPWDYLLGYIEL